jgi:alkanesulfonate monooxygenase SsuD/methylene tetrahydromethanopterin reductase-like flavin-dependent oxidoreductase (luciferase family)
VAALAHVGPAYEFAAAGADVVFITPTDDASVRSILDEVRAAGGAHLKVLADVVVSFRGEDDFSSDALVFTGSATELVDMVVGWQRLGVDGVRLRPAVNAADLPVIVDEVVPLLQRAGRFRTAYRPGETLRARLGLPVAPNRYAAVRR